MDEWEEKIVKSRARNLPCFTCLIRPLCIRFDTEGSGYLLDERNRCDSLDKWDPRTAIPEVEAIIVRKEFLEFLKEEKENVKSCENR
jgi:hypothetical protein